MQTLMLFMLTSGLVLLQTTQGLGANLEPDEDFLEEAMADGFIVKRTTLPNKTEKTDYKTDNYNAATTLNTLNAERNPSLLPQEDSLSTVTIPKNHEADTELTTENPKELLGLITVIPGQATTLSSEENTEGSGIFPELGLTEIHTSMALTPKETITEMDNMSANGSGMFPETLNEERDEDLPFTTTVRNPEGDFQFPTIVLLSSEVNDGSGMGPESTPSDGLTTKPTIIEEKVPVVHIDQELAMEKPTTESIPNPEPTDIGFFQPRSNYKLPHGPEPTIYALAEEGTPDWLIILAFCLTLGAIICILAGIATKDMWYGPSRRCLNIPPTDSNEKYVRAATLPLSEKEMVTLLSSGNGEKNKKDFTMISVEEKEYLM